MNLTEWAHAQGICVTTAYRWWREGTLPIPARKAGRMNAELAEAALAAHGRRLAIIDDSEVTDDLVRDVTGVPTSFCARLYGRRSARNQAEKALRCAARNADPASTEVAG